MLHEDLAKQLSILKTLASKMFPAWVKATAAVLKYLIFVPKMWKILLPLDLTNLVNFHDYISLLMPLRFFLKTPKNHAAQRITWSNYKHHDTGKFLITISPNGLMVFASVAYGDSILDKQLTVDSGYLDLVEPYTVIMVDKGFNIKEECTARFIDVHVPPGNRGHSQMLAKDIKKTNDIGKFRVSVEQVMRRFKTFNLIAKELLISLVNDLHDIIVICAALNNLQSPIYK